MITLRSFVSGEWHEASRGWATLVDPCSEQAIARASSDGVNFEKALAFARDEGGAALRALPLPRRGSLLQDMSRALQDRRDDLIRLSLDNTGATRKDAKFDIDGAIFTLSFYGRMGEKLGEGQRLVDGDGLQLGRSARFWGQHLFLPLHGVAVHINAFNFPVWGIAEKAACALLAGMPVITKPATSTALVAARAVEFMIDQVDLPPGALSLVCGSTGDLLDRLGPQDVLAFTGSASTARALRAKTNLLDSSTRVNIEADSLNAAVLGPDLHEGDETWGLFVRDVVREMTQKSGQKCTAVRRILVPAPNVEQVQAELVNRLSEVVVGNPREASVNMGPLATAKQIDEALGGLDQLRKDAELVLGSGARVDGVGNPPGKGFFLAPTLLRAADGAAPAAHRCEVFGPVATILPYDGSAASAASIVALGQGTLVTSVYSDDRAFLGEYLDRGAASTGRLYIGSAKVADQLPGSGVAMPHMLHGGPGRAGGGQELGGPRGLELYLQRVGVMGDRALIDRLAGLKPS